VASDKPFGVDHGEVIRDASPRDVFYSDAFPDGYFRTGHRALQSIESALHSLPATHPQPGIERVLDFGCGYGRVLRYLRAAFPEAGITACDIETEAVDFCAATFGATPAYSTEDPHEAEIDGEFDLIWCGSVLTHLDSERWTQFLELFSSLLAQDGLLVFTTHGRRVADILRRSENGKNRFRLEPDQVSELLSAYDQHGFGYQNYPLRQNYGFSLSAPSWVVNAIVSSPDLRLVALTEMGWVMFQDTVSCIKRRIDGVVIRRGCEVGWVS
jgi:SAM-dependent methyltransferase